MRSQKSLPKISALLFTMFVMLFEGQLYGQAVDYGALEQLFNEPVTTSVTGSPQRVSDVPATIEIITAKDIRRSGAKDIPGVLRHVRGIDTLECGNAFRTKGYYQSTLRSVYGKVSMRIRRLRRCSCSGSHADRFSTLLTNKSPITPELRYLTAKMAALLTFRKVVDFLGELLPLSAQATASTVRNRTMKVGRRLQKSAEVFAAATSKEPCKGLVVGFDGGYVRNRHQRPERNFEVVAGKALDRDGHATRFAFVRSGGPEAVSAVGLALRRCGVNESTSVTVLTDGDAGLRAIHQQVAPHADHILDWSHITMRFSNLQLAKGINSAADGAKRSHALAEIDIAKWRLWNGLTERGIIGLVHLGQWAQAECFAHIPFLE
jgi:hypothetical protein